VKVKAVVLCPRCGGLVGFQFEDVEMENIEKVRFKIGEIEYPTIDIKNLDIKNLEFEKPKVFCPYCGHEFDLEEMKEV